jgi:hypothetical protein
MTAVQTLDFTKPKVKPANDPSDWGELEPFDAVDVPAFPIAALSPWLRDWAHAIADFCQVPVDLPSVVGLAALSLAVCRRFHVRVVPGWDEPTNLYTVTALPPAERKSPVFAKATAPLHAYQKQIAAELAPQIARRATERKILQGQIDAAMAAAVKGKAYGAGNARNEAMELAAGLADLPEMHVPGLLADDCTPEALAVLLGQSHERIGLFSAEGGPFEIMNGRYSDKGSNFELFLKAHPGDPHAVNRIRREPVTLDHPLVAIALTVQPAVIQGLAAKEGFRGLGLLARFLYSLPCSLVGRRAIEAPEVPEPVERHYHSAITAVLRLADGDRVLTLTPEAHRARCAFQGALEPRLADDGDLMPVRDWAGKLTGTVCRLAAVLHVGDHAFDVASMPLEIPAATFDRAVAVGGDYFLAHALAAFNVMGADESTELAKRLWAWVQRRGAREFSEREAARAVHADGSSIKPALLKLCERGLIREHPSAHATGGRPASPRYEVRP